MAPSSKDIARLQTIISAASSLLDELTSGEARRGAAKKATASKKTAKGAASAKKARSAKSAKKTAPAKRKSAKGARKAGK